MEEKVGDDQAELQQSEKTTLESEKGSENTQRRRGMLMRQSFSLDEDMLSGVSFGEQPNKDKEGDMEFSILSSKKKEECMKIYEKMTKTGCPIKLDTIFR